VSKSIREGKKDHRSKKLGVWKQLCGISTEGGNEFGGWGGKKEEQGKKGAYPSKKLWGQGEKRRANLTGKKEGPTSKKLVIRREEDSVGTEKKTQAPRCIKPRKYPQKEHERINNSVWSSKARR